MGEPAALIESFRTVHAEQTEGRPRWARHRKPILLAIGIALFNQLSGINAILYYLNDIFAAAGFSRVSADVQAVGIGRSEEHTSELQSLMRISYAVFCLKKKKNIQYT